MKTFKEFWSDLGAEGQRKFAASCGSSVGYLYLIARGHKHPGPKMAIRIEKESFGVVSRSELRSDLWRQQAA